MTRQQIIDTYGTDLCRFCFPEIEKTAPVQEVEKAPETDICPGSGTWDWKYGEPEKRTYYSPGGTCGHCGEWAGFTSRYNDRIRKHKRK